MKKRILIIEDNSYLSEMLQVYLEKHGFNAQVATNVNDALDMVEVESPDLAFCDLLMPERDGRDFLKTMQEQGKSFPVVVFTNLDNLEAEEECRKLGARDFMVKNNLDISKLKEIVAKYLSDSE